jgi:hypothetical protein
MGKSHTPEQGPVDYYEVLHVSTNAELETIERVYRLLAQGSIQIISNRQREPIPDTPRGLYRVERSGKAGAI